MVKARSKIEYLLWLIGAIGAIGEAVALNHDLIHSYPYKMMSFSFVDLYCRIGEISFYLGIPLAVISPYFIRLNRNYLITILPVIISPLVFLQNFYLLNLFARFIHPIHFSFTEKQFDGYTGMTVIKEFTYEVFQLLIAGIVIGFISSKTILFLSGRRKQY